MSRRRLLSVAVLALLAPLASPVRAASPDAARELLGRAERGMDMRHQDRQTARQALDWWRDSEAAAPGTASDPAFEQLLDKLVQGVPLNDTDRRTAGRWARTYDDNRLRADSGTGSDGPPDADSSARPSWETGAQGGLGVSPYLPVVVIGIGVFCIMVLTAIVLRLVHDGSGAG